MQHPIYADVETIKNYLTHTNQDFKFDKLLQCKQDKIRDLINQKKLNSLFIDDDPTSQLNMENILQEFGPCTVANGDEYMVALHGMQLIQKDLLDNQFHAVFIDQMMEPATGTDIIIETFKSVMRHNIDIMKIPIFVIFTSHAPIDGPVNPTLEIPGVSFVQKRSNTDRKAFLHQIETVLTNAYPTWDLQPEKIKIVSY